MMKTRNMTFMEAVQAMRQDKKVRRAIWAPSGHFLKVFDEIRTENNDPVNMFLSTIIDAIDWEIVEEKKTLSDKIVHQDIRKFEEMYENGKLIYENRTITQYVIFSDNVKEALKKVIVNLGLYDMVKAKDIIKHIKEIFGEELTK